MSAYKEKTTEDTPYIYGLNQSVFSELSFGKGAGEKGLMGDVQYIIDIIFHSFFYQIIHPFFQPSLQSF